MRNQKAMLITTNGITTYIIGFLLMLSTGCATFQKNQLPPVTEFPSVSTKKTVSVDFTYPVYVNGNKMESSHIDAAEKKMAERCITRLKESGLFASVSKNAPQADLALKVELMNDGKANLVMASCTGGTFYLIPSSATEIYKLSAVVTDTRNYRTAEIKLEDGIKMWQQILLLPLLPFKSLPVEAGKCQNKLFDHMVLEIEKSGLLQ